MDMKKGKPTTNNKIFEGTIGTYVKRESPPRIPLTPTTEPPQGQRLRSTGTLTSSRNSIRPSDSFLSSNTFASQSCITQSSSSVNNIHLDQAQASSRRQGQRQHLSSHSFNVPHSSMVRQRTRAVHSYSKAPVLKVDESNNGDFIVNDITRRPSVKSMPTQRTSSHSIDGVEIPKSFESSAYWLDQLPPGWDIEITSNGIRYYVDHNNGRTHWIHPFAQEILPSGWSKVFDHRRGVLYYNEGKNSLQTEHPGLGGSFISNVPSISSLVRSGQHSNPSQQKAHAVQSLNIVDYNSVPDWLRLYSESDFSCDNLLDFSLFKINQLKEFDQKLLKLYKQAVIDTVYKFENTRREINQELCKRQFGSNISTYRLESSNNRADSQPHFCFVGPPVDD